MMTHGKMKPWMERRATALHQMCEGIALDISTNVPKGKAYKKGKARFNRTKIARARGMTLGESAVRGHYARWKENPSPECFDSRWGASRPHLINPVYRRELILRAIHLRINASELYRRLNAEVPRLNFCRATLMRELPTEQLHAVTNAQRALDAAITTAMKQLDLSPEGGAAQ
jgi:hypothetical protein